ncbi:hypothetical protein BAE44_0019683 [Dichanthelium oligosanthes]|uniref:Uncharacterized protein n=1 Tax=Dichanthelium oligosanthes TaxID=888268 RepID=A0A1E5V2B8_9POAL|nr:hypothetical protein BAE44_0019683 [Dichanthelium oligosanthes]
MALLWRRHRWTALRSLLLVALLHRIHCLAFLAASSPVWLLAAFLLGVVLVHSEPNVPLAGASEDEDRHLYKKIRHLTASSSSSDDDDDDSSHDVSSATSMEERLVGEKEEEGEVLKAAVAWTADDEHSIQSIGSLELERDARLEKLMSRRSIHRNLIDLDVHIPAVLTKNPFDLHPHHCDDPGSAPSSLLGQHSNPFDFDIHERDPGMLLTRHESFTAGAAPRARPSRFRPYFVADVPEGGGDARSDDNSNSSSSPSSSAASDHQAHQQAAAVKAPAAAAATPRKWDGNGNGMAMAVDVELISDSSDDDMSLPGDDAAAGNPRELPLDEDEEDSFEVESITQQVAAGERQQQPRAPAVDTEEDTSISSSSSKEWVAPTTLASVEENEKRERELSEIREHHILGSPPAPVIDNSSTAASAGAAGAVVAAAAPAPAPAPAATPGKPSSKSKAASKKAVFGFFRK